MEADENLVNSDLCGHVWQLHADNLAEKELQHILNTNNRFKNNAMDQKLISCMLLLFPLLDIAVGAPYDGSGRVYLYCGSSNGINTKASQVGR